MSFGGSALSAKVTTENNLRLLRKSTHNRHKFLNVKKTSFPNKKNNKDFIVEDYKDIHTSRATKEAIFILILGFIPFAIFLMYWLGIV